MMWLAAALAYRSFDPPHARISRRLRAWYETLHPRFSPADRTALARAFASWAADRDFVTEGHDARYVGRLAGKRVVIDGGIRDSGTYDVVVTVDVASGLSPRIVRRGTEGTFRAVFDEPRVLSVRVLDATIEVRLSPGTSPDAVETAVSTAIRQATQASVYR
jgi:hypothetical protein